MIILNSARKYGVSDEDIMSAFGVPYLSKPIRDDPRNELIIGYDTSGNLIEVIFEINAEHDFVVFHAMKCRKSLLSEIERRP